MSGSGKLKQILFVQGGGEGTYDEWDNKLVQSLERELGSSYEVLYPRMPDEANPSYVSWKKMLQNELSKLKEGAILVGHSLGGAFLIHSLAEHWPTHRIDAIALIAPPFFGGDGWKNDEIKSPGHLTKHIPTHVPIFLYHGAADDTVPVDHLRLYTKAIPQAKIRVLANRDHQLNNDLSDVAQDLRKAFKSR